MPKSRIQKKEPDCGHLNYIDIHEQEPNVSRNYSLLCLERTKKENNSLIIGIDKDEPPKISIIILNTSNMKKAMLLTSALNYFIIISIKTRISYHRNRIHKYISNWKDKSFLNIGQPFQTPFKPHIQNNLDYLLFLITSWKTNYVLMFLRHIQKLGFCLFHNEYN